MKNAIIVLLIIFNLNNIIAQSIVKDTLNYNYSVFKLEYKTIDSKTRKYNLEVTLPNYIQFDLYKKLDLDTVKVTEENVDYIYQMKGFSFLVNMGYEFFGSTIKSIPQTESNWILIREFTFKKRKN